MCGAAASSDATRCEHCGARLATVACPSCFGMIFVGAKFCSHCGAKVDRKEAVPTAKQCPRCHVSLDAVVVGKVQLLECSRCEGIWADVDSFQQICTDREEQAALLGVAAPLPVDDNNKLEVVRYIPCPVCNKLMNRVNFAHCSHVVVDVCKAHGTWFDKDELRRIVEFIRAGGFDKAREMEMEELERQRRALETARSVGDADLGTAALTAPKYDAVDLGLSAAGSLLKLFLGGKS